MALVKSLVAFVVLVPTTLVQMALWVVRGRVDTRFFDAVMGSLGQR